MGERFPTTRWSHLTPEQVFEPQWALTLLERAVAQVRQRAHESGTQDQFETLKPYLMGEAVDTSYAEVGERLGLSESGVKSAVSRLRKRFGKALRAEIAETVADPAEVEDELRRMLLVMRPF